MDEVQHLADRVVVLAGGRIVAEGSPDMLGGSAPHETIIKFRLASPHGVAELPAEVRDLVELCDGELVLRTADPTHVLALLCNWAIGCGIELHGLEVVGPSLEDVYLQLTEAGDDGGG
jgi:ABC-2 type transport system ATP-binding protein